MIEISNFAAICILLFNSFSFCFGLYWKIRHYKANLRWERLLNELRGYGLYDQLLKHRRKEFVDFYRENLPEDSDPDVLSDI